ncbi:hypothetical protein [Microbacterium sp. Root61]|uniref:hypothetical protein n=1 Tax=Microbacterium sp. Root61 TaxID=1736570 RepID=UPI000AB71377|nr:hypothetical protein [Microbacterium sp. Root61]
MTVIGGGTWVPSRLLLGVMHFGSITKTIDHTLAARTSRPRRFDRGLVVDGP